MGSKHLNKLDPDTLLLPELDDAVHARGDEEVCVRRDGNEGDDVAVHEGFAVFCGFGEGLEVELLVGEDAALFLANLGGEEGHGANI